MTPLEQQLGRLQDAWFVFLRELLRPILESDNRLLIVWTLGTVVIAVLLGCFLTGQYEMRIP